MGESHTLALFFSQLILLIFFGRMFGELFARVGQPAIFGQLLVTAALTQPSFTVRGGTNEILRSVASKGLRPSEASR